MNLHVSETRPTVARPSGRDAVAVATGVAGILAIVVLFAWIATGGSSPDVTSTTAAAKLTGWLAARSAGHGAVGHLALGALSYVPLIVFLAGLRRYVERLEPTGLAAAVVGVGGAMFLAGAVVSDGASMALGLSQSMAPAFGGSPDMAIVLDRMWLIALTEANVALGVLIGAAGIASLMARRTGYRSALPGWLSWWAVAAAGAVVPLALGATNFALFVATNQIRLLWILAASVVLLKQGRRATSF